MTVRTNVKVKCIGADKTVQAEIDGSTEAFPADQVLLATGRPLNVEPLQPQAAAIELDRGLKAKVSKLSYHSNLAASVRDETEGMVKVVYQEATEKILGAHVSGAHAEDIVQIAAMAIKAGLKKSEVGAMHYVFPTLGGAIFDTMAS